MPQPHEAWSVSHRTATHECRQRALRQGRIRRRYRQAGDVGARKGRRCWQTWTHSWSGTMLTGTRFGVVHQASSRSASALRGSPWQEATCGAWAWRRAGTFQGSYRPGRHLIRTGVPRWSSTTRLEAHVRTAGWRTIQRTGAGRLQLGVYALAAQGWPLENVEDVSSAYWFVTTRGGVHACSKRAL